MKENNQTSSFIYTTLSSIVFLIACIVSIFPNNILIAALLILSLITSAASFKSLFNQGSRFFLLYGGLFLMSAGVGYWAAHNQDQALQKLMVLCAALSVGMTLASSDIRETQKAVIFSAGSLLLGLTFIGLKIVDIDPNTPFTVNRLDGLCAILTPYLLYLFFEVENRFVKAGALLGFGFALFTLVIAQSLGAIVAILVAIPVWFFIAPPNQLNNVENRILGRSLFWAAMVMGILAYASSEWLQSTLLNSIPGAASRIELYANSKFLLDAFWVFGAGLDSFSALYSQYIVSTPFLLFTYGHHLYTDILLEQGALGLLAFCALAFGAFSTGVKIKAENSSTKTFIGASLASLTILLVHGFIDDAAYGEVGSALLFVPAAAILSIGHQEIKSAFRPTNFVFAIVLVLVVAIGLVTPAGRSNIASIEMAKIQLVAWPTNEWSRGENNSSLEMLIPTYKGILQSDPNHPASNYHLGLIHMELHDFSNAESHFSIAVDSRLKHPGLTKNLGYSKLWQGDIDDAKNLLNPVAGIDGEIEAYVWWWAMLGEKSLEEHAKTYHIDP